MAKNSICLDSKELEVGMELAQPVYSNFGMLLLNKETILDEKQIEGLILLGIKDIFVVQEDNFLFPVTDDEKNEAVFQEAYQQISGEVDSLLQETISNKVLDQQKFIDISNNMMADFSQPETVLQYMARLQSSDNIIYNHSMNVALIAQLFSVWFDLPDVLGRELIFAALVHDIGKAFTAPVQEELHTVVGAKFLADQGVSKAVQMGVLMHHEREDGTGYPTKSSWWSIHPFAKIIAIADFYDHATNPQNILQEKVCPFNFIKVMETCRYGKFDIKYLDKFLYKIANYCLGSKVRLTDGRVGKLVFINCHALSQPIVQLKEGFLDLYREKDVQIKELL